MALSQKHRSVLFEYLAPNVGEDAAEALMAEFPTREGDELVTKDFLRAELADLRSDLMVKQTGIMLTAIGIWAGVIITFS
jgi:hypothetical protein